VETLTEALISGLPGVDQILPDHNPVMSQDERDAFILEVDLSIAKWEQKHGCQSSITRVFT